jgi:hypothetical protein
VAWNAVPSVKLIKCAPANLFLIRGSKFRGSKPFAHMRPGFGLPGFHQDLFAQRSGREQLSLLVQTLRFICKIFRGAEVFRGAEYV